MEVLRHLPVVHQAHAQVATHQAITPVQAVVLVPVAILRVAVHVRVAVIQAEAVVHVPAVASQVVAVHVLPVEEAAAAHPVVEDNSGFRFLSL